MNHIRVLTLGIFRRGDRILVAFGEDPATGERFMRPLGGAVDFGERAADALQRELREEIAAAIDPPVLRGVLEDHFVYAGRPCHEIAFVFDVVFADPAMYERDSIAIDEPVWIGPARWVSLAEAATGAIPLYPRGLLELLT